MKQLRQAIRKVLLEDRDDRRKPFVTSLLDNPNYDDQFRHVTDEYSDPTKEVLQGYHDRTVQGRIMKKAFAKYADRNFVDKLKLVHWTKDRAKLINMIKFPSNRDELSTAAYLPGKMAGTSLFGKYGLVIAGHITLLANDMNQVESGYSNFYTKTNPERTKRSGANKGIGIVDDETIVLSKEDWEPDDFLGNEALVDNWNITGVIMPDSDYDDMAKILKDIYKTTGKEYNIYKASSSKS